MAQKGEGGRSEVRGRKTVRGCRGGTNGGRRRVGWVGRRGGVGRGTAEGGGRGGFKCRRVSTSLWDRTQDSPTLSASLSRIEARRLSTSSAFSLSLSPLAPLPSLVLLALSFSAARPSLRRSYIAPKPRICMYARLYVRTRAGTERGRNPSFPRRRTVALPEERERTRRQTRGERSRCEIRRLFPPTDLSVPLRSTLSHPPSLSSSRSAAPLHTARVYVRAARGVTYPSGKPHNPDDSRHFAVPLAPDDTRKPNGKRKYDADFRSVETNAGNSCKSRRTAPDPGLVPARIPPPPGNHPRAQTLYLFAVTSECWKLDSIGRDNCRVVIGRRALFLLSRKTERISIGRYPERTTLRRRVRGPTRRYSESRDIYIAAEVAEISVTIACVLVCSAPFSNQSLYFHFEQGRGSEDNLLHFT